MEISKISFGARIQIDKLQKYTYLANEIQRTAPLPSQASTGSNYLSSAVSTVSAVSAGKTAAVGSGVTGTAFVAKASGIDMFGIAPSVIAKCAESAPQEFVATSVEKPEVAGSLFSTLGAWFDRYYPKQTNTRNIPN